MLCHVLWHALVATRLWLCARGYALAANKRVAIRAATHEQGIGFNVFRAVVAANATASIVPVPGHYNDNGIIERTASAQDMYWSSRAIFVHGIKGPMQYQSALRKWTVKRPDAYLGLRCFPCTSARSFSMVGSRRGSGLRCGDEPCTPSPRTLSS